MTHFNSILLKSFALFLCLHQISIAATPITTIDTLFFGDTEIEVHSHTFSGNNYISDILFVAVHHNEQTSVKTAKKFLGENGGKLVEIVHDTNDWARLISFKLNRKTYTVDPNRIYTDIGRKATLKRYTPNYQKKSKSERMEVEATTKKFAEELIDIFGINQAESVVSLHNNGPGGYSIKSYGKNGKYNNEVEAVNINKKLNPDNFYYVVKMLIYKYLESKNTNVILQGNPEEIDDGSLSTYCFFNNINYVNVEAGNGQYTAQFKMMEILITDDSPLMNQ